MRYLQLFTLVNIMSLAACNNYGLLNQLESPGTTSSSATGGISVLYLFASNTPTNGNLKGAFAAARDGADAQCQTARATYIFPDNSCSQIRAVISLSTADSISSMPSSYNIPTNKAINASNQFTIAPDWNTFINGTSGNTLAPNVMPAATSWWSFSTSGGLFDNTNNCSSGGSATIGVMGATADSSTSGGSWLAGSTTDCGNGTARLLCICY